MVGGPNGATVNAIGGAAGNGGDNSAGNGGKGAVGGRGLSNGTVTIYYGTINATGGKGGNGGNSTAGQGGNGGEGGFAIAENPNTLTLNYFGGIVNATSGVVGTGGTGTSGNGSDATRRKAFGNNYVTLMNTDATLTGDGTNITATTTPTVYGYYTVNIVPNKIASGSCGTNVNYSLTSDGVMTISGTGAMADYATMSAQPWYSNSTDITSIVVEEGVTHIGNFAFAACINATSILLPTTLTSIGNNAFYNCNNAGLTLMTIPENVATIGIFAFRGCKNVTSISLPTTLTSIGNLAFGNCSSLTTVTLNSNPYIGSNVFNGIAASATVTMNLTANTADGAKWMTFYNKLYSFVADANTQVFKAELSGTTITLYEVDDKIVDAGTAVVLKTTGGGDPVMTLTTSASSNTDSNSLEGVSDAAGQTSDGTMYVLNYKAATGVGFYKLTSGKTLGVGKAYLTYDGSTAPSFFGFGDVTAIDNIANSQEPTANGQYYDLQGRRVAQPTKGLYIVNGKKVVIK